MRLILAILMIPTVALANEPPAPKLNQTVLKSLSERIDDHEQRLLALEGKLQTKSQTCPCPDGCDCPPGECRCFTKHGARWKSSEPTNKGLELLYFGADWCVNCPAAIDRLGNMTHKIVYVDCTDGNPLASKYGINAYPSLIAIRDGVAIRGERTEGSSVGEFLATQFLNRKTVSQSQYRSTVNRSPVRRLSSTTWTWPGDLRSHLESTHGISTSGLTQAQLRTVHDNLHTRSSGIGSTTTYTSSGSCPSGNYGGYSSGTRTYYTPQVYYRSYGSCPTCR